MLGTAADTLMMGGTGSWTALAKFTGADVAIAAITLSLIHISVGIDLQNKTGIRFCAGDAQKWKEQPKREWDKYTFGCYGC